jgi:pyruvate kinase
VTVSDKVDTPESIGTLIDHGMDIARLDFSWGDQATWVKTMDKLKTAMKTRGNSNITILMDTRGIEIKTSLTRDHKPIQLFIDQELEICNDANHESDERKFGCSLKTIGQAVSPGDLVILDKELNTKAKVTECKENSIIVTVLQDCQLGERKHMHLCGAYIDTPSINEQDEKDIIEFGVNHSVDAVAISFTRSPADIEQARAILRKKNPNIMIFAKIESFYAMRKFEEILSVADGIIVNRQNLGYEFPPSKLFFLFKWMTERAKAEVKPIYFQNHILESMLTNSDEPTRYEVGDLVGMIEDGIDGVILS